MVGLLALPSWADELVSTPIVRASGTVVASIILAYVTELVVQRVFLRLAKKTKTDLDDKIIEVLRQPVFLSVIFFGLSMAAEILDPGEVAVTVIDSGLQSIAIVVWSIAGFRIGTIVLTALSKARHARIVRPASLPVFLIFYRVALIVISLYFVFLAWEIDLTAWLASAGILGIAVGFAAKDTLANLFAGVFILADSPYKVGDVIVIDGKLRGRVVHIGMRSTRLLTRDDVEITIPNAVIGTSTVLNEAGGPQEAQRVRIKVFAAYGCDVDQVKELLLRCPDDVPHVCSNPGPEVRLRELGDSGLRFELLAWVDDAAERGRVIDALTTKAYNSMNAAGVEIPYNKLDVYLKDNKAPSTLSEAAQ